MKSILSALLVSEKKTESGSKLRTYIVWLVVPSLIALCAIESRSRLFSRKWNSWLGKPPVLDCPKLIDLGEHEKGEVAMARLEIWNRGKSELHIRKATSNCPCAGLEQQTRNGFTLLKSLKIAPPTKPHLAFTSP